MPDNVAQSTSNRIIDDEQLGPPQAAPDEIVERRLGASSWKDQAALIVMVPNRARGRARCAKWQIPPLPLPTERPPPWGGSRSSVLKLRHGLQFILGDVIHRVVGIPILGSAGCCGCLGSSCGTGGGSRLPSGARAVAGAFAGADVVEKSSTLPAGRPTLAYLIEGDCHIVLAQAKKRRAG